jgi:hypothetical protein
VRLELVEDLTGVPDEGFDSLNPVMPALHRATRNGREMKTNERARQDSNL